MVHLRWPKLHKKTIFSHKKNSYSDRKNIVGTHRINTDCKRRNNSSFRKYTLCHRKIKLFIKIINKFPVTERTKNTSGQMKNISWCKRYSSCEIQIFYIFPVIRKFLPVRRKVFPLTARTTDWMTFGTIKHRNTCHSVSNGLSFNGLKNQVWFLLPTVWGAISKLIPWLWISDQSCHCLQFYVDYRPDDDTIFSRCFGRN